MDHEYLLTTRIVISARADNSIVANAIEIIATIIGFEKSIASIKLVESIGIEFAEL